MPTEATNASAAGIGVKELLAKLEVPFSPEQVQWRVTNTTNDKKRGQVAPYADPRAYTDRLNALLSPQGWTREYKSGPGTIESPQNSRVATPSSPHPPTNRIQRALLSKSVKTDSNMSVRSSPE